MIAVFSSRRPDQFRLARDDKPLRKGVNEWRQYLDTVVLCKSRHRFKGGDGDGGPREEEWLAAESKGLDWEK